MENSSYSSVVSMVRKALTDSDRKPKYRGEAHPMAGHCYVAAEAVYHLLGGKAAGVTACRARVENDTHWWLVTNTGVVIDPTADQFSSPVPYNVGTRTGFLTKAPSRRCRAVLDRIVLQQVLVRCAILCTPPGLAITVLVG